MTGVIKGEKAEILIVQIALIAIDCFQFFSRLRYIYIRVVSGNTPAFQY